MSPNNGILLNGVLRPRLLNNRFDSCFLEVFLSYTAHFDDKNGLPSLVYITLEFILCTLNYKSICFFNLELI